MYGLGLHTTLSALVGLGSGGRAAMRPAHGLAAHRRLAALHTAALALGLTARRYSAKTGGEGLVHWAWFHPANIAAWYHTQICFVSLPDHFKRFERLRDKLMHREKFEYTTSTKSHHIFSLHSAGLFCHGL
jgi:hypothetical protein